MKIGSTYYAFHYFLDAKKQILTSRSKNRLQNTVSEKSYIK